MGQWFKKLFERQDVPVLIAGRQTTALQQKIAQSDIVIISVPIQQTKAVIEHVIPLMNQQSLLADLTSVKVMPLKIMESASCGTLGLHPLFGNTVDPQGQTIVFCQQNNNPWVTILEKLFQQEGMKILKMSAEEHDKQMALIQSLTHAVNVSLSVVLQQQNISEILTTPTFALQQKAIERVVRQDPELIEGIQFFNPFTESVFTEFQKTFNEIRKINQKQQPGGYKKLLS